MLISIGAVYICLMLCAALDWQYAELPSSATSIHKNNETNDKFYRKVAFLMYTEMVNFKPQS